MGIDVKKYRMVCDENENLRVRLEEAEETLSAIRGGEVDALLIGDQVYTLEGVVAASNRFRGEALSQINDVVMAVDNDRRVTYLNPAAERQYRISASDVLGRLADEFMDVRWNDGNSSEKILELINKTGYWSGESIHTRRDGTEFYADTTVSQMLDGNGDAVGRLAVIRDITERKRAEEALHKAHDNLEIRVAERTRELAQSNSALEKEMEVRSQIEKQRTDLLQRVVSSQEDERRRIARDIHDKLGQRVTALRLQIASFVNELAPLAKYDGLLEMLQRTAHRLDSEVSFLAWELRPAALDDLGLPEAARAYLEDWSHNYKISSEFDLRGFLRERLHPDAETHLYRIMQEALNNIVKHAKATSVNVLLDRQKGGVIMIVEDNGQGFDYSKVAEKRGPRKGLGLLSMRERAILVGGDVQIETAPGAGTTLFVRIPSSASKSHNTRRRKPVKRMSSPATQH